MRQIKFRGKRVDNGEWVIGSLAILNGQTGIWATDIIGGQAIIDRVDPETVGQYTGLEDKYGAEIYEDSIFHVGDKNIKYQVVWHDTGFMGKQMGSRSYIGLKHWSERIEIIGNIHQNPELLRGAQEL